MAGVHGVKFVVAVVDWTVRVVICHVTIAITSKVLNDYVIWDKVGHIVNPQKAVGFLD